MVQLHLLTGYVTFGKMHNLLGCSNYSIKMKDHVYKVFDAQCNLDIFRIWWEYENMSTCGSHIKCIHHGVSFSMECSIVAKDCSLTGMSSWEQYKMTDPSPTPSIGKYRIENDQGWWVIRDVLPESPPGRQDGENHAKILLLWTHSLSSFVAIFFSIGWNDRGKNSGKPIQGANPELLNIQILQNIRGFLWEEGK